MWGIVSKTLVSGDFSIKYNQKDYFHLSFIFLCCIYCRQQLGECNVITGQAELKIPPGTVAGMYMGVFKPVDGALGKEVRIKIQ
jgi:hypothetical protein